jgi:hypothetical protein
MTGLNFNSLPFYLKGNKSGNFIAAVAYTIKDESLFGAFIGYAGGGVYDGGFFDIDLLHGDFSLHSYDDAGNSPNSIIFKNLMQSCSEMFDDEDPSLLSIKGRALLKNLEHDSTNEITLIANDFDGDILCEVSNQWNISLRFDC